MPEKYIHPDRKLAVRYIIASFILFILDYLIPFLGIISVILMFFGIRAFIHNENVFFGRALKAYKKMALAYIVKMLFAILGSTGLVPDSLCNIVKLVALGIGTIYYIYVTHYFTEGILLDAKAKRINFAKLDLNTPWILLGMFMMAYFICLVAFKQPIPNMVITAALLMGMFYCIKLYQAFPKVYCR